MSTFWTGADNIVWSKFIYHAKRNSSSLRNSAQSSWKARFRKEARLTENRANGYGQFLISNKLVSLWIFASYRVMHWDVFHCKRQLKLTWITLMLPTACCGSMNNLRYFIVIFVLFRRRRISFVETKRQGQWLTLGQLKIKRQRNPQFINSGHNSSDYIWNGLLV